MEQIANATGAGDSFLGAMLYSHVNDFDLEQTLETAMTVSMLTIQSDNTINPQMSESFMRDNLALATEDTSVNSQDITF
jgi:pseudouridine kinase